jgi:hypothetical protein
MFYERAVAYGMDADIKITLDPILYRKVWRTIFQPTFARSGKKLRETSISSPGSPNERQGMSTMSSTSIAAAQRSLAPALERPRPAHADRRLQGVDLN